VVVFICVQADLTPKNDPSTALRTFRNEIFVDVATFIVEASTKIAVQKPFSGFI
jgi:hypothetical protein